ncbi:MAG TPA: transcriptional regulator [Microcoleaceae bacterium UBA10368]|jgi:Predicted transcription regulator containing HTH domain|nr:transcriptional regulator [Microcoleaceae cyanobacterium UBA10368]
MFDSDKYSSLLSQYQPRIIKNEDENEIFLEIVEKLLSRNNLTPEEDTVLELLVKLIEDFEEKSYQINASTPHSRLLHLMDARSLEPADLVEIMDTIEIVTQIINNQLEITKKQAEALGKFFHVNPSLFLCN